MNDINVGIDLGGSHVAIGVVNNEGKILEQFEKDFTVKEKENVLPVAIRYMVDTLRELKQKYDLLYCVVSCVVFALREKQERQTEKWS